MLQGFYAKYGSPEQIAHFAYTAPAYWQDGPAVALCGLVSFLPDERVRGEAVRHCKSCARQFSALPVEQVSCAAPCISGYHAGCRCAGCRAASRDAQRRIRRDRLDRVIPAGIHGKKSTYENWSCRCRECSRAVKRYALSRRAAS